MEVAWTENFIDLVPTLLPLWTFLMNFSHERILMAQLKCHFWEAFPNPPEGTVIFSSAEPPALCLSLYCVLI